MKFRPLHDRVVVKRLEEDTKTAGGIIIPDTAKEKPQRGRVLAVGDGRWEDGKRVPLGVDVGDEVIYSKYGGTDVKVGDGEVLILSEHDILAKVDGAPAAKPKSAKKK